ncbi:cytochrome P450 [Stachybotrys elegans]|uniref:Cytochrome P450 n=1 Tax=Stachybotrys elegans TaxID=80388 RepID=A0A8K0WVW6_9HYPO|nr:cytochrome P450 [Stachybotrys elegans]
MFWELVYAGTWQLIWSSLCAAAYLLSFILLLLVALASYRLFLHPLSCIPGPRLAAISNAWQAYHARNGRMAHLGRTLHEKYGPVVRVGPEEVWFNSREAYKAIYSMFCAGSGLNKADFYLATALTKPRIDWLLRLEFPDSLDLLSERDTARYRRQRRLIGPLYQTSHLIKFEPIVDNVLTKAIARLKSLDGAEVDLKEWMHIIAVECLSAIVISWSPGFLKLGTDRGTSSHSYQGWRRKSVLGLFPAISRLAFRFKSVGRWFSVLFGVTFETPKNFRPFFPDVNVRILRRIKAALRPDPPKDDRRDLLFDLIQLHKEKEQFTEDYLKKMAVTNFGAGHETLASTLTSVVAMIASHEKTHKTVTEEIRHTAKPTELATAAKLTHMQAAIKEAKRLHPVIAMSLPRGVPAGGLDLDGYHIPAGTTVGCNPIALHRNEDICGPSGASYEPERWLDADAARRMERFSLSWGGGARSCPGRHLAELIVFKAISSVFYHFDVEVVMPPEDERREYFLSMLVGVKARFKEKEASAERSESTP